MTHHKNNNLVLFILGIIVVILFSQSPLFTPLITTLSRFGIISGFIAGMLFASTFTIAGGGLILISLAKVIPPTYLIIAAGIGAVTSDLLIYYLIKNQVVAEVAPVYERFLEKHHLKKLFHTRYFAWTLPVVGAIIIASPLPDELGISLMGLSTISPFTFILISLASHTLGMTLLITTSLLT